MRTFAWMVLLQKRGLINKTLVDYLGLIETPLTLDLQSHRRADRHEPRAAAVHDPAALCGAQPDRSKPVERGGEPGRAPGAQFPARLPAAQSAGLLSGSLLVFVLGLGYYITPALLGGPGDTMIAQLIEMQVADFGNWGLAAALAVILLAGTVTAFMFVNRSLIAGAR